MNQLDTTALQAAWVAFQQATGICQIRDEAHYDLMCKLLDELWDETHGDDAHPLWGVCELVGFLIHNYESQNHPF